MNGAEFYRHLKPVSLAHMIALKQELIHDEHACSGKPVIQEANGQIDEVPYELSEGEQATFATLREPSGSKPKLWSRSLRVSAIRYAERRWR